MIIEQFNGNDNIPHATSQVRIDMTMQQECPRIYDLIPYSQPSRCSRYRQGIEAISVWRIVEIEVFRDIFHCFSYISVVEFTNARTLWVEKIS
jgi:hypothetical protein